MFLTYKYSAKGTASVPFDQDLPKDALYGGGYPPPYKTEKCAHRSRPMGALVCKFPRSYTPLRLEIVEGAQDHEEVSDLAGSLISVLGDGSSVTSDSLDLGQQSSLVAAIGDGAFDPLLSVVEASLDHNHVDGNFPGGHTAGVAVLSNLSLDLLQHVGNVALVAFSGDVESGGIAVVGSS